MNGKAFSLAKFQGGVGEWHRHNFPAASTVEIALKLAEEVGELAHACGQLYSGIGDRAELQAQEVDAIGDIMVVLAAYCAKSGIDLTLATMTTWAKVSKRDWQADPVRGGKQDEQAHR